MKEYYGLKNTVYKNWKQLNMQLNQFNYYGANKKNGTLLHSAVSCGFGGYVELLLKDGFDPNSINRHEYTSRRLAKRYNNVLILSLLGDAVKNENTESKEDEIQEEKEMDMRSLSLRYDVMYILFFTSFLLFFFCLFWFLQNMMQKNNDIFVGFHKFVHVYGLFFKMFGIQ